MQKDCDEHKLMLAHKSYGVYASEILEGRRAAAQDGLTPSQSEAPPITATALSHHVETVKQSLVFDDNEANDTNTKVNETPVATKTDNSNTISTEKVKRDSCAGMNECFKLVSDDNINFVLGDSNAVRVHVKDPDVKNVSKQGQRTATIDTLLSIAESKANGKAVKRVVIHLGTNDISKCRADTSQCTVDMSTSITETHKKFPDAEIAFSSILPRRGKTTAIKTLNDTANAVNDYVKKLAKKESYLYFIDNNSDFLDKGLPNKELYDSSDSSGIHVSDRGADILAESFQDFFNSGPFSFDDYSTPVSYKRNRSVLSNTPPSDKQMPKINKIT